MSAPLGSLFLHYFDPHVVEQASRNRQYVDVEEEASRATRLALLAADTVYLPAASYVESDVCRRVIDSYKPIWDSGQILLVGGEPTLADYALGKEQQYPPDTPRGLRYAALASEIVTAPAFRSRRGSATSDLRRWWTERSEEFTAFLRDTPPDLVSGMHRRFLEVPEQLTGLAFTPENVISLLLQGWSDANGPRLLLAHRGGAAINSDYVRSFTQEFNAGIVYDLVNLDSGIELPRTAPSVSYRDLLRAFHDRGLTTRVFAADPREIGSLREQSQVVAAVLAAIYSPPELSIATQLVLPIGEVTLKLDQLLATRTGRKEASRYAKRVQTVIETMFAMSLGPGKSEAPINEGRKRIDILFPNLALGGAFAWTQKAYNSRQLIVECKNYVDDPANPEVDQLLGRISPSRGRFGLLLCRRVDNMDLLIRRCGDIVSDHDALLVPVCDADLVELVKLRRDPGHDNVGDNVLTSRMLRIHRRE